MGKIMYFKNDDNRGYASEILAQLTCDPRPLGLLAMMLGTTRVMETPTGIVFDFKLCKKYTHCLIELDLAMDLYCVSFFRQRSEKSQLLHPEQPKVFNVKKYDEIYSEQLNELFSSETGLALVNPFRRRH